MLGFFQWLGDPCWLGCSKGGLIEPPVGPIPVRGLSSGYGSQLVCLALRRVEAPPGFIRFLGLSARSLPGSWTLARSLIWEGPSRPLSPRYRRYASRADQVDFEEEYYRSPLRQACSYADVAGSYRQKRFPAPRSMNGSGDTAAIRRTHWSVRPPSHQDAASNSSLGVVHDRPPKTRLVTGSGSTGGAREGGAPSPPPSSANGHTSSPAPLKQRAKRRHLHRKAQLERVEQSPDSNSEEDLPAPLTSPSPRPQEDLSLLHLQEPNLPPTDPEVHSAATVSSLLDLTMEELQEIFEGKDLTPPADTPAPERPSAIKVATFKPPTGFRLRPLPTTTRVPAASTPQTRKPT
ncbi:hypothetical protein GOODEAATRI_010700 [Goodea atripinnis]|uniref:Uncharacterized protein n=1 Tax=Goodea atripinnis TaxID=208336 RepID=A0ABV0PWZ1_9TELE